MSQPRRVDQARIGFFREVLPDQAVGVIVRAALTRAKRTSEEALAVQRLGDLLVTGELASVVEGEGMGEGKELGIRVPARPGSSP